MNLLKTKTFYCVITLVLLFSAAAGKSFAESTIKCHCFKDRSYNSANRFAADDYILATSFNSLLSRSYNIPKRQIIMLKMKEGVGQDDLLISLQVSELTGLDHRKLLSLRRDKQTWSQIFSGLVQQDRITKDPLMEAVRSGLPVEQAGDRLADKLIKTFYKVTTVEINKMRLSGLSEKEIALVFILAHARGQQPAALVEQYKKKGKSWSEIAADLGVEPETAGKLILVYPAMQASK
jgi:hypothetical protein